MYTRIITGNSITYHPLYLDIRHDFTTKPIIIRLKLPMPISPVFNYGHKQNVIFFNFLFDINIHFIIKIEIKNKRK